MYKRIQIPYVEFLKREELKNHPIMKKITNDFIIIANGFSIYELLYHRHWFVLFCFSFQNVLINKYFQV